MTDLPCDSKPPYEVPPYTLTVIEDSNCPHGKSEDEACRACQEERLAAWTDEQREAAVEEAQEQVYETAHDLVVAATDGDAPGVEALLKSLNIRLQTILNKGPLPWTDSA